MIKINKRLIGITLLSGLMLVSCGGGKSAKQLYKEGISLFEQGNYQEASTSFQSAIEKNDEKADYYVGYGMSLIQLGQYEEAIAQFDRIILDKKSDIIQTNNKKAYRGKGITYLEAGEFDLAREQFEEALKIKLEPSMDEDIKLFLGDCYLQLNEYENALSVYQQLLENNKNIKTYIKVYEAQIQMGETEAAKATLEQASALTVKTKNDKYQQALVYYYQGKLEQAITQLTALAVELPGANYLLGEIYTSSQNYEQAITYLESYLSTQDKEYVKSVYYAMARNYVALEQYDNALMNAELGLGVGGRNLNDQLMKIQIACYEQEGEFDTAYELAKEYVATYPDDQDMQREYSFLESRNRDTES